jgi:hypothetical protein
VILKTGISKSGKFMPYMMRPMMADEDINDIIVYLRSDDDAAVAADTTIGIVSETRLHPGMPIGFWRTMAMTGNKHMNRLTLTGKTICGKQFMRTEGLMAILEKLLQRKVLRFGQA